MLARQPRISLTYALAAMTVSFGLVCPDFTAAQTSPAAYKVSFEATWSSTTHPLDFPSNPHFSLLVGGTHGESVTFWEEGSLASTAIESMAESGNRDPLKDEVNAAILAGTAQFAVLGGGIGTSPGVRDKYFTISSDFPRITLVSMLAPSPDWFVGVSGVSLFENGQWLDTLVVPLAVFDSGTDSGTGYASPNEDTVPHEPIFEKTDGPFALDNIVGSFTFSRQDEPFSGCDNPAEQVDLTTDECNALISLYDATSGPDWTTATDWKVTDAPCSWFGITCVGGHVVGVSLGSNELAGRLPPTLGALAWIDSLHVSGNALFGAVPLPVAGAVSTASVCSMTANLPGLCLPDIFPYQVLGPLCGLPLDPACDPVTHLDVRVFLEASYDVDGMAIDETFQGTLPATQPYASTLFDGTLIEHDGPEALAISPHNIIDWVSLSLRTGLDAASHVVGSRRAGLLRTDGLVVDTNGTALTFEGVPPAGYHVVVGHRNHLAVISSDTAATSSGYAAWDFTSSMSQAHASGMDPMKEMADGRPALYGGDADVSGAVQALDFNAYLTATAAGETGYVATDFTMDGAVQALDFNIYIANTVAGAESQVPE